MGAVCLEEVKIAANRISKLLGFFLQNGTYVEQNSGGEQVEPSEWSVRVSVLFWKILELIQDQTETLGDHYKKLHEKH